MLMSIVFQVGDFDGAGNPWYYDVLIVAIGASVGILGAYFLYLYQVRQVRVDRLKYVSTLIRSVIKHAGLMAQNCEKLADAIDTAPTRFQLLVIVVNNDLKRLVEDVDQEGFYHAYLWQFKRNDNTYQQFKQIYNRLDYIHENIKQIMDFIEKENSDIHRRKVEYADAYKEVNANIQDLLIAPLFRQQFPQIITYLTNIYDHFHNNWDDPSDIDFAFTDFIQPLFNYITTQNVPVSPEMTILIHLVNDARHNYKAITLASQSFAKELRHYHTKLNAVAKNLKEETTDFINKYAITNPETH